MINRRFSMSETTFLYPRNDVSLKLRPHGENIFLSWRRAVIVYQKYYLPIKECIECIAHGKQNLVALKLHVAWLADVGFVLQIVGDIVKLHVWLERIECSLGVVVLVC